MDFPGNTFKSPDRLSLAALLEQEIKQRPGAGWIVLDDDMYCNVRIGENEELLLLAAVRPDHKECLMFRDVETWRPQLLRVEASMVTITRAAEKFLHEWTRRKLLAKDEQLKSMTNSNREKDQKIRELEQRLQSMAGAKRYAYALVLVASMFAGMVGFNGGLIVSSHQKKKGESVPLVEPEAGKKKGKKSTGEPMLDGPAFPSFDFQRPRPDPKVHRPPPDISPVDPTDFP